MSFSEYFAKACEMNGLAGFSPLSPAFERLTELLLAFNAHTNLTSVRTPEETVMKHYVDSLTAAGYIPPSAKTVVDVGCGGGFPTLPLAIALPGPEFTGLDSTEKKLRFVSSAAVDLGLNVKTLCSRAEDAGRDPSLRESFDVSIARAVARLNALCELCLPLTKPGGLFIAMKGPAGDEEAREAKIGIAALGGEIAGIAHVTLADPLGGEGAERTMILIEKKRPTPDMYPRQYAKIVKKPL